MSHAFRPVISLLVAGAGVIAVLPGLVGCAYSATGAIARPTLIFEATVEGAQLTQSNNIAYYFIIDADGDPATGPLVNGPAPITRPYPDPRSYLPFVRDQNDILDREPITVPNTVWNDFFWLYADGGTLTMWQGRKTVDAATGAVTVNERFRQLQNGREWGLKGNNTIQLTLPLSFISLPAGVTELPLQLECNLAVGTRAIDNQSRGFLIERWGRVQNTYFTLKTTPGLLNLYDNFPGVTFPNAVPAGLDQTTMNFTSITYRVSESL